MPNAVGKAEVILPMGSVRYSGGADIRDA